MVKKKEFLNPRTRDSELKLVLQNSQHKIISHRHMKKRTQERKTGGRNRGEDWLLWVIRLFLTFRYILYKAFGHHCCSFQGMGIKEPETRIQLVALSTCSKKRTADRIRDITRTATHRVLLVKLTGQISHLIHTRRSYRWWGERQLLFVFSRTLWWIFTSCDYTFYFFLKPHVSRTHWEGV